MLVKMKIAYILGTFPTPNFINNQIVGLLKRGHKVNIYAFKEIKRDVSDSDIEKYNLNDYVTFFAIPSNKVFRIFKAIYLFLINFHRDPLKLIKTLNFVKYGKDAINLNILYYTVPFLKSNYDILHCHFGPNGLVGSFLREMGIRGKIVTTFYGYDLSSYLTIKGTDVYSMLFKNGDLFLPICKYFRSKLVDIGCDSNKIEVNYINIDISKYKFIKRVIKKTDVFEILTVAVFEERKGYEYSLKAIKELEKTKKNIRYTIAGDGLQKNKMIKFIEDLKLQKIVNFVGRVNQKELIELYNMSHVFLLPSITTEVDDQEGTPTVILEAQATGLPIITTKHSGIPEIVLDNESGFIVPERAINAITDKLNFLIENPGELEKMGYKGRKFIEKNFEMGRSNSVLENEYKKLIGGHQ